MNTKVFRNGKWEEPTEEDMMMIHLNLLGFVLAPFIIFFAMVMTVYCFLSGEHP